MNNLFSLEGKNAIVTGGVQGLGYAMAEGLLENNVKVVIFDLQNKLDTVVEGFRSRGFKVYGVQGDISEEQTLRKMFREALNILGRIDIIINSAGVTRRHRADEFPVGEWDFVHSINLRAVFMLCQLAGKEMIKQGSGKIINIASMNAYFGGINNSAYAASKGGIALLTKSLASDWAKFGINVNAIAPGYMRTELNAPIIADEKRYKDICGRIPAERWGNPEDLKGPVLFLASSASDYVNGVTIPVDGGYLVR